MDTESKKPGDVKPRCPECHEIAVKMKNGYACLHCGMLFVGPKKDFEAYDWSDKELDAYNSRQL